MGRRLSGRHGRDVAKAVIDAGGQVEVTSNGHLIAIGPKGRAVIGVHNTSYRGRHSAMSMLRRYAGLDVEL